MYVSVELHHFNFLIMYYRSSRCAYLLILQLLELLSYEKYFRSGVVLGKT